MLRLALLGRPSIDVDDVPVALPTKKSLALIAYVAVDGAQPRSRIAEALWTRASPDAARSNLRRELNRLRHTPVATALVADGGTLALREPFWCDVHAFRSSVESHDFGAALHLYAGPLLDGFELDDAMDFHDWLEQRRMSLAERQRSALAERARALEQGGDPRAALQVLLDLVRLDETQETYQREAMRLHYLIGEREAALERFARLKRVLKRELAVEPLPETVELAKAVRAAQRIAPRSVPQESSLPVAAPLVGREREISRLRSSPTSLALLLGDPGVGKSRLAEELALGAADWIAVRGSEMSIGTALYGVTMALASALERPSSRERLLALPPMWRREAGRLLPELDANAPAGLPPEARPRFLEGLARTLAAAVGPGGVVLVDDMHWLDPSSVEVVLHLARRAPSLDARVVATARPFELADSSAANLVATIERERLGEVVRLAPLDRDGVLELVRAMCRGARAPGLTSALDEGAFTDRFAEDLYAASGGNPLYVIEIGRAWIGARAHGPEVPGVAELPMPSGVRDAVQAQVDRVGPAARRLLEAASLIGGGFLLEDVRGASALPAAEAVDALERAVDAGLLVRAGTELAFHHDLVRRALSDGLSPDRQRLLHGRIAEALARRGAAAASIASHFSTAGDPERAAKYRTRAAQDALRVFAYQEALAQYALALEVALPAASRAEIRAQRAAIFAMLDDRTAWSAELDELEALAARADDPALPSRALGCRAELENAAGRYREALEMADRALEGASADKATAARAQLEGGRALLHLGRADEANLRLTLARTTAPARDATLLSAIHRALYTCALDRNVLDEAQLHNDRARRVDQARQDRYGLVLAHLNDGTIRRRAGDAAGAVQRLEAALRDARDAGLGSLERAALLALCSACNVLSEFGRAAALAEEGVALSERAGDPLLEARFCNALAAFDYARGNLGSSITHSERAIAIATSIDAASWCAFFGYGLAHTLVELGACQRAREVLEDVRRTVERFALAGQSLTLETHLAQVAIHLDGPAAAVERIERALTKGGPPSLDPDLTATVLALSRLRAGDADGALAALSERSFRALYLARVLSIRIPALLALGRPVVAETAQARALLDDPKSTPLEALELHRAILEAALRSEPEQAAVERRRVRERVDRIGSSLGAYPVVKEGFLELWREPG